MFRILTASKDTYIQNKYVAGTRSLDANVGQAATIDLFKLYGETRVGGTQDHYELSRGLIKFDYSPLTELTASQLNASGSGFKVFLSMKNAYGGQTVPSNFTLQLHPVAQEWDEGRGNDVLYFSDIDSCNWITASVNPSVFPWVSGGVGAAGAIGDTCDYYVSGDIGVGSQSLAITQTFTRGDENLFMDITSLVSASIWGNLPNHGFRLSYVDSQEQDQTTRFVKRFGGRNANNPQLRPSIVVKYDGDVIFDDSNMAIFDESNRFYIYNTPRGVFENFKSGSSEITGANCLNLELVASKSNSIQVTGWSPSHSQSITYTTTSISYFSASFPASQVSFGGLFQEGSYCADVTLATFSDPVLDSFVSGSGYRQKFLTLWKSLDNTYLYASGSFIQFQKFTASPIAFDQRNYVVNMTNLEQFYNHSESTRLRVFIQDWEQDYSTKRLPKPAVSRTFRNMYWRLIDPFTKEVVIPFDDIGTRLSSDGGGMFFDFWFSDLNVNRVYEFEFQIRENGKNDYFLEQGFRFKVTNE
jgi:hypothetical protein